VSAIKKMCAVFFAVAGAVVSSAASAEAPVKVEGATTVNAEEARRLYESGAVFIDVREAEAWKMGHIDGAVHLDFNEDEFVILYVSEKLDRSTPIVFYSNSALSSRSAMASYFAAQWGYKNVHYFRDGYYAWMAKDYPMNLVASRPKLEEGLSAR